MWHDIIVVNIQLVYQRMNCLEYYILSLSKIYAPENLCNILVITLVLGFPSDLGD